MAGDYPQQITKDVTFLMGDCSSAYKGILGRATLNSWKAATSTYHLIIKFPTDYGIGGVARRPNGHSRMLHCHARDGGSPTHHVYRRAAEPVEELEEVTLDESRPERTTKMGTLAS